MAHPGQDRILHMIGTGTKYEELGQVSQRSTSLEEDDDAMTASTRGGETVRHRARSIPGRMDNSDRDASMMGGVHHASKVAELRMWFEGVGGKKTPSGNPSMFTSLIDELPYALPIVAACILILVIIAVRILRKTQPQSTTYIQSGLSNVKVKSGRRY
mmetsp:Transcript_7826/g.15393  ORF Transcript_7826/g.15393 Transcript_7826/m.15393 type:complete len:158 (+) Transcript_7826:27-500(+)